jgi:eukaryotic-like serine/threonine-protein kinase
MAEVFLAHDEVLKRDVALKILRKQYANDEGFVRRFRREAQSAASLNHPRIVVVYDWGRSEDDGTHYMAMEYVPGGTLKDRILRDGALPPHTAVDIASQIACALEAAHRRGVVHRDVKPQNVLLTTLGDVKVADFGIARAVDASTTSGSSLIFGTASYMSPEQAKGEPVGPRSDLYSLGVVLYEMLTGEVPYEADTPAAVAAKHVSEPPRSPREANPEVPEGIDTLTLRLLAKGPADRYASAAELLEDLRRVRNGLALTLADAKRVAADGAALPAPLVLANPSGDGTRSVPYVVYGRRFRRLPLALTAAFIGLLVLLGVVIWGGPWSDSREQARVLDVAGGPLDGLDGASERGEQAVAQKEEVPDAGLLPAEKSPDSSKANTPSNPKLGSIDPVSNHAVLQNGVTGQDHPEAGSSVKSGGEIDVAASAKPEWVSVPEISGRSVEEAWRTLSEAGHVVVGTVTRHSPEPTGTVIGTNPPTGSTVKRGSVLFIMLSSGPTGRKGSNGDENGVSVAVPEATPAPTQPQKTTKGYQRTAFTAQGR